MPHSFLHQILDHVFVGIPISPHLFWANAGVYPFIFCNNLSVFNCDNLLEQKPSEFDLCSCVLFFFLKQKYLLLFLNFFPNHRSFAKRIFRGELVSWSHRESKDKFRLVSFLRELKIEIFFWNRFYEATGWRKTKFTMLTRWGKV